MDEAEDMTEVVPDKIDVDPDTAPNDDESGDPPNRDDMPDSTVALLERRPFPPPPPAARLNICGIRPRLRLFPLPVEPSGAWMDWYCSNSARRALRALR
jgi:hypothetical protein